MKKNIAVLLVLICVLSACARRQSPDNFYFGNYSEAEALYGRQEYEHAIQKYQAYIDENPEGNLAVISRYYMGRSYAALGRKEEAKSLFDNVIAENPDLVWANFSKTQLSELEKIPPPDGTEATQS